MMARHWRPRERSRSPPAPSLHLDECPDDWDPLTGVDGDKIILGQSLPQSGALAAFGAIGEGMQFYFDYVNDTDPIDGKEIVLVLRDDGYEAGRAVANVEEMIDTEDIFAFVHMIGTPINFAVRPITDEACVPQLFNSSGFPFWGDPANFPWTVGNILNYVTETEIWCAAIVDEFGEGATVASLIMNNDFGKTYQNTLQRVRRGGQIDVVDQQLHDPAAPDVTNEMTTLIATDADVFIAGTTRRSARRRSVRSPVPSGVRGSTCRTPATTCRASSRPSRMLPACSPTRAPVSA